MQDSEPVSLLLAGDAEEPLEDHLGWNTFRPPPKIGLAFGAIYGAIAGMFIAYDVAVLIRIARVVRARIRKLDKEPDAAS